MQTGGNHFLYNPVSRSSVVSSVFEGPHILIVPILVVVLGFIALQTSVPLIDYQLNADSMYVIMIVKDILFDGGTPRDWYTSVHLFLYPDMVLAIPILLMQKLGLPVFVGCIAAYGLLLISVMAFAWRKITNETLPWSLWAGSVLFGIIFCGDYFLYKLTSQQAQTPDLVTALKHTYAVGHVLGPALHSGAFILTFLLFFALEDAMNNAAKRSFNGSAVLLAWISFNAFLVTLSDLMFVPWGIVSLSVVVLSGVRRNPPKKSLLTMSVLWVPATLGYLLSLPISGESTYVAATGRPLSEGLSGLIDFASLAVSIRQPTVTFFFGTNVLLWFAGAYSLVRELICPVRSIGRCLIVLAASMSISSILAPAAAGLFTGWQIRYLIPYLFLGPTFCLFVFFFGVNRLITRASWSASLSIASLAIFAMGIYTWETLPGSTASQLAQCLSAQRLGSGRAGFWDAAPVVVASGWRLNVAPLVPGTLVLYPWLTNRKWLQQATDPNSRAAFLILDSDLAKQALEQYGPADHVSSCAGRRILIYKHPLV
jgi:hypothetical protein